jgi:hypothetical protein
VVKGVLIEHGVIMSKKCILGTCSRQFPEAGVYSCKCYVYTGTNFLTGML